MTALLWLRRDLRLHDHPALWAALEDAATVVPVFCLDPRLLAGRHASAPRTRFLLESLADLGESLRARGSGLVIRRGRPERLLPRLARELDASRVFWTDDVSPFAARRDRAVRRRLEAVGAGVRVLPGLFVLDEPEALLSSGGRPYRVFTPFHRAWLGRARRTVLPAPRSLPAMPRTVEPGALPTLEELGIETAGQRTLAGGERAGRLRMRRFVAEALAGYDSASEDLDADACSRLSPYLHLGCVSARELEARLSATPALRTGSAPQRFRRQLCWRDFYAHVLAHAPANARQEFQERYRGSIRWSGDEQAFHAWCEGRTGYPLVDAAMRQLLREGWIHNRARLVVGSFLTKDLGIDWRWGERWFMRLLLDGDQASNNGNWQWIASVGVDPQPPSRRIYNPARQQARLDPHGVYVRRHVPELRGVPDAYLAEPWTMPRSLQREVGCVIGSDYPAPLVDHLQARREALERYALAGAASRSLPSEASGPRRTPVQPRPQTGLARTS